MLIRKTPATCYRRRRRRRRFATIAASQRGVETLMGKAHRSLGVRVMALAAS